MTLCTDTGYMSITNMAITETTNIGWYLHAAQDQFLHFYDTWVARDSEGTIFGSSPNTLVGDPYSMQRYQQGLAFPVTCCWNGLAVFDAKPLQQGYLFFK